MLGISKIMLGQIEWGELNFLIVMVWKIVNGFKVLFIVLIYELKLDVLIVMGDDIYVLMEENGRVWIYLYFFFEEGCWFEMYVLEMDEVVLWSVELYIDGIEEFIIVFEGEMMIYVGGEEFIVKWGEFICF